MNKMISIFLYGAWKNNLGDDLFLKIITQRYPDCTFHILTNRQYIDTYDNIGNLVTHVKNRRITRMLNFLFRRFGLPDYIILKMSKQANVVIFLGGSLYQQEENWKKLFKQRMNMVELFNASFAIGNNFGPFTDNDFYNSYKTFFKRMEDVCFRDKQSRMLFPYSNVRNASDIVFGISSYCPNLEKRILNVNEEKPCVVISIINLEYASVSRKYKKVNAEIYEKWISKLIFMLEQREYSVVLMGFCTSEGDDIAIDRIIAKNAFKSTIKYIHHDINESLAILRYSDLIIATRFHSMILGWAFDKKVAPIVYGNKMKQVIQDTGFDGCCVDIEDIDQYDPEFVIDNAKKLSNLQSYIDDSSNQFSGFDKWLANR